MSKDSRYTHLSDSYIHNKTPSVTIFYICQKFSEAKATLTKILSSHSIRKIIFLCTYDEKNILHTFCTENSTNANFSVYVANDIFDWYEDANQILLNTPQDANEFLFFLSSHILFQRKDFEKLIQEFASLQLEAQKDGHILGINPILLAEDDSPHILASLGFALDSQGQLHFLYEGKEATPLLTAKKRSLQFGIFDAMLLRMHDFLSSDGFEARLSRLAPFFFCLKMRQKNPDVFFTVSTHAYAIQKNPLFAWDACGLWNSMRMLGRISAELRADYHLLLTQDGFTYGINEWLSEGISEEKNTLQGFSSRHDPIHFYLTLLKLTQKSDQGDASSAIAAASALQKLPEVSYFFPQPLPHYEALAKKITRFAKKESLPTLDAQIHQWIQQRPYFQEHLLQRALQLSIDAQIAPLGINLFPASYTAFIELEEPKKIAKEHAFFEEWRKHLPCSEKNAVSVVDPSDTPKSMHAPVQENGHSFPLFSLVMPVYNPDHQLFRETIRSIQNQTYPHWQLCMADDCSTDPRIRSLMQTFAKQDPRITITFREENGHISEASNSALRLARGEFIGCIDQDDCLHPYALEICANALYRHPHCDFFYSDEDQITENGVRRNPLFRSCFSLDSFIPGHFMLFRRQLVTQVHGFKKGREGAQDRDLVLRIAETLSKEQIHHIPCILYHWRIHAKSTSTSLATKPYILEASKTVLKESYTRRNIPVCIEKTERNNFFKIAVQRSLPKISLILLERKGQSAVHPKFLRTIESLKDALIDCTLIPHKERSEDQRTKAVRSLQSVLSCTVQILDRTSPKNMREEDCLLHCAEHARGELLFMLATDLVPLADTSPNNLLLWAALPHVGMVGSMLYRQGRLWHGGLFPDVDGYVFPLLQGSFREHLARLPCSFPTFLETHGTVGAHRYAMAIKKDLFLRIKGLNSDMGAFAEAAACLALEDKGFENCISVWGQWELQDEVYDAFQPQTPSAEHFLHHCGKKIRVHPLRNPNLRMAKTRDWQYLFK